MIMAKKPVEQVEKPVEQVAPIADQPAETEVDEAAQHTLIWDAILGHNTKKEN